MAVLQWFAWCHPLPANEVAVRFSQFAGQTLFSDPIGAPVALYSWLAMESAQARPERADTGLIGRSPTAPVGAHEFSAALERGGGGPYREALVAPFDQ